MKSTTFFWLAAAGVLAVGWAATGAAPRDGLQVGSKAPTFTAKGSDAQSHTLASTTRSGPVILYFIKSNCPVNAQAVKFYNRIAGAYPGSRLVGVIDEDEAGYQRWAKQFKPTFPVLFDKSKTIISSYKAQASPWAIHVKDGKVAKVWDGYSVQHLDELNRAVASASKSAVKPVDLMGAPKEAAFG